MLQYGRPVRLGQIEMTLSFDYSANILYITIMRGRNFRSFVNGDPRPDAFIMGYLLPGRRCDWQWRLS